MERVGVSERAKYRLGPGSEGKSGATGRGREPVIDEAREAVAGIRKEARHAEPEKTAADLARMDASEVTAAGADEVRGTETPEDLKWAKMTNSEKLRYQREHGARKGRSK